MFKMWGRSDQLLQRYSNFHILRLSSIQGRLPLKVVFIETLFDFSRVLWAYGCWYIQMFIFWGHLPLEVVFHWRFFHWNLFLTSVCFHELRFKIWGRSDHWLLGYLNFHFLRSYSIRGHLSLKVVFIKTLFNFGLVLWADV